MCQGLSRTCLVLICAFFSCSASADTQTQTVAGTVSVSDWTNGGNAASIDGSCTFPDDLSPAPILLTNWGFTIPPGAVINGISVTARGASTSGTNIIQLIQGGTPQGSTFDAPISGGSCPGTAATVGSPSELWGLAWTAADINASNFGVSYDAEFQGRQFDGVEITVDFSAANGGTLGTGAVNTAMNNNSVGITVPAGSNRVLIAALETIGNPTAVTFNGMNFTEIGAIDAGFSIRGELWGLVLGTGPEIVGTITAAGFNTSNSWNVTAGQAFENIDQATPWETFTAVTTGGGTSTSSIMIASAPGDIVFDAIVGQGNGGAMSATAGAGQTVSFNGTTGNGLGAGSTEAGTAMNTMSWDFVNFLAGAHMGINLNGVAPSQDVDIALSSMESIDPVVAGSGAGNLVHTITATNNGPSAASGVAASATIIIPAGVTLDSVVPSGTGTWSNTNPGTWTIGDLASGASETLTITFTVSAAAAEGTDVIDTSANVSAVNETDTDGGNDATLVETSVDRQVDIVLSGMDSIDPVVAGSGAMNLTHTYSVMNTGPSNASGVALAVSAPVPAGTIVDSIVPSAGSYAAGTWSLGDLAAGAGATLTVTYTVGPSTAHGQTIGSTVAVSAVNETDTNPGNDSAGLDTDVIRQIDVTVTKTDDPDPVIAGLEMGGLEYVVTVTNNGPSDATGVIVADPITFPAGVTLDSWVESAGSYDGLLWVDFDLPVGATETLVLTVTVGPDTVPGDDVISNTASFDGVETGGVIINPGDDSATETTSVTATTATWRVNKDFLDDSGGSVTMTLSCTSGTVVTPPVQVSEGNPQSLTVEGFLQGPFGSTTCTVTESNLPAEYFQVSASDDCEIVGVDHEAEYLGCVFVNAPISATFHVTKDFDDDNPAPVNVWLECNTGLPLQQSAVISEFGDPFDHVDFVVGDFVPGGLDCDVFEEPVPPGYAQSYVASVSPGAIAGGFQADDEGCHFEDVQTGSFDCAVTNTLLPVDVTVNKQWIDEHPEYQSSQLVNITLRCANGDIVFGYSCGNDECIEAYIDPANPGAFQVFPDWDGTTQCSVSEEPEVGVDQDVSDCADIGLAPGLGGECTIVNTRLYAGIPTLSQTGLALLALLMLGIGMVTFRRFV